MRDSGGRDPWNVSSNYILSGLVVRGLILLGMFWAPAVLAQSMTPEAVAADPLQLVKRAVANELKPGNGLHPFKYRLLKLDDGKRTIKEIVETKDGEISRVIEQGGQPLSGDANQTEIERLNNLLAHPEVQERKHRKEQADNNRDNEMVRMLPDAFLYHYEGTAEGPSGEVYRLSLKPNPTFNPPDRQGEVYAGMAGELWIDQKQERMVKLDVHLIADVNFGWGILGKLYKGGSILVEQKDVGNDHWEQYHFTLNLQGKALLFKSLVFDITEDESDYEAVPAEWRYQDAVRLLLGLKLPGAQVSQR